MEPGPRKRNVWRYLRGGVACGGVPVLVMPEILRSSFKGLSELLEGSRLTLEELRQMDRELAVWDETHGRHAVARLGMVGVDDGGTGAFYDRHRDGDIVLQVQR